MGFFNFMARENVRKNSKPGTSIPAISLPKGGGAITGMGEKSQSNPVTGTASFQVPVKTSPSRNAFHPELFLSYDSGNGNSIFGLGWSMGIASITRKTQKGLPKYDDQNESDVFLFSGSEDLVPFLEETNGTWKRKTMDLAHHLVFFYRPRTEGSFSRIERWYHRESESSHWVVRTKENITSIFGEHETSRIVNPEDHKQVFQWLLERTFDDKGSCIEYSYKQEDSSNIPDDKSSEQNRNKAANSYLKRIRYGNTLPVNRYNGRPDQHCSWLFEVVMDYGEHTDEFPDYEEKQPWMCRQDPYSDYRAGFEIRTYRLCQRILMFHHFKELGEQPCLVASTGLGYEVTPAATFLRSVQRWSYEPGKDAAPFPPVSFLYSKPATGPSTFFEVEEGDPVYNKIDFNRVQWTDLFGEGITGLLYEDDHAWWYKRNVSEGQNNLVQFNSLLKIAEHPSLAGNKSGGQLTDVDGDGNLEVMVRSNGISGFFEQENQQWKNFQSFTSNPNINWKDPNLRMIDLTGDGHADILISEDRCFTWHESKIKEGYGTGQHESIPFDKIHGPDLVFNDGTQSIYLADMSGDGLTDLVRIRNGEVCYWPNLGYGKFGNKITFDLSPHFDNPDQFDQKRIRLADIDGSGTTDILYIYSDRISYWINQSGNSFSDEIIANDSGPFDNLSQIQTVDLFGKGTSCLVISNPASGKLWYIDLVADGKPHLLLEVNNNMGALSRFHYATSTKFYQQDEKNGTPWITKLPFPVHVVEKTETIDLVDNVRFTARYAYHHGYYDGVEREFRGFGMVEQWDTELYEDHIRLNGNSVEEELYAPPVYTRTWFHTGFLKDKEKILEQYTNEYYRGDPEAWSLVFPPIPSDFEADEAREAARAFKGSVLRQEVYSKDASEKEGHPYTVTAYNYNIRQLQPGSGNKHSVFHVTATETLTSHYERNPDDPRIRHQINLETDAFGNVTQSIAISYPRRKPAFEEQGELLAILKNDKVINAPDKTDWYRLGVAYHSDEWEVSGFLFSGKIISAADVREVLEKAVIIPYENKIPRGAIAKREVGRQRICFYNEFLTDQLPSGEMSFHALSCLTFQKALTPAIIQKIYGSGLSRHTLEEAGYVYEDEAWWQPSGKIIFDARNFYLPIGEVDPLGNINRVEYDDHHLFPLRSFDAAGNETQAHYDYRVLQACLTTDANGNHVAVAFDTRGHVIATAVMGKNGEGDTPDDPTSKIEYNIFNWNDNRKPNFVRTFVREKHKDPDTPWQLSYSYSNGLGNEILKKVQAEDGEAFARDKTGNLRKDENGKLLKAETAHRWVGNGRVILNNKGKPVKQYEPYFTDTPDYEDEGELREYGVTPVIQYDPLERVIRTDLPDGTFTKSEFDGWRKITFDANDTVLESEWYRQKMLLDTSSPDYRAAQLASKHANTPHLFHLDSLGREFVTVEDNAGFGKYSTHTEFDIEGKQRSITDAKGRTIARYEYDILGKRIYSWMADAGERRTFYSLFSEEAKEEGKEPTPLPLILWDSKQFTKRIVYDALHRVTQVWLREQDENEKLIEWNVFGEEHPNPLPLNLRKKVWLDIDQAGLTKNCFYDFKGNTLETQYKPGAEYKLNIDWQFLLKAGMHELEIEASSVLENDTYTSQNQYDALNRVVTTIHPDGTGVKPFYNKANLLEKVSARLRADESWTEFVGNIDYDEKGQRISIHHGNGTKTSYRYDEKNFRLVRLFTTRKSDNAFLQDLYYTYDPAGNITEIKDEAQQTVFFNNAVVEANGQYEYDAVYRLIKATGRELAGQLQTDHSDGPAQYSRQPGNTQALRRYTQHYSFDELGNILSMAHQSDNGNWKRYYRYKPENNHLLETSSAGEQEDAPYADKYIHDVHGNMTQMPHLQNIQWNFNNQTSQVDLGGGGKAYYVYNSGGHRTRKVVKRLDGLIQERFYVGSFEVYRERRNGVVELERETIFIGDDKKKIAQIDTLAIKDSTLVTTQRSIRYQYSNHLGSATLELDEDASIISYEEYHPFGTSSYRSGRSESEVNLKRYRYSGKERDEETGLYYYGARHLIAWLGRWSSADPAGFVDGVNVFAFVKNSPISHTDAYGKESKKNITNWDNISKEVEKLNNIRDRSFLQEYSVSNKQDDIIRVLKGKDSKEKQEIQKILSALLLERNDELGKDPNASRLLYLQEHKVMLQTAQNRVDTKFNNAVSPKQMKKYGLDNNLTFLAYFFFNAPWSGGHLYAGNFQIIEGKKVLMRPILNKYFNQLNNLSLFSNKRDSQRIASAIVALAEHQAGYKIPNMPQSVQFAGHVDQTAARMNERLKRNIEIPQTMYAHGSELRKVNKKTVTVKVEY